MIALDLNSIAQISAARIADCLIEGSAIAVAAGVLLRAARRLSSGTRFAVWFSALMAIASLPVLRLAGQSSAGANVASAWHPLVMIPAPWALYIFCVWVGIATFLLARVGIGVMHVFRLRQSCVPIALCSADSALRNLLASHGNSRQVALCSSELVNVPTAIGFTRPAVVLPAWLIGELSPAELRQVVLHELAHLRRWDDWTNLAQQVVEALLFFHPAVWWIEKRVSLEREMACDDAVLAETANPRAYAECLAHLAEKSMIRRGLALAQAAVGRIRQTSLRVARILGGDRPIATRHGWFAAAAAVAGFALLCGSAVSRTPSLIAFEQPQPHAVAAQLSPPPPQTQPEQESAEAKSGVIHRVVARSANPETHAVEVAAKLRSGPRQSRGNETARLQSTPAAEHGLVQPARWPETSTDTVSATQAVYVVIESREYLPTGVVVWRSSLWRIAVMPPADPNTRIPRKQT